MQLSIRFQRGVAVAMVGMLALLAVAPAAHAGNGHKKWKRNRGSSCETRVVHHHPSRIVIRDRHHHDGSTFAGFLGGLVVGAAIGASADRADARDYEPRYVYVDPYCDARYRSFEACRAHVRDCGHAQVIHVLERDSGDYVHSLRWRDGRWREYRDDDRGRDYWED